MFGCLLAGFYLLRIYDMATATYVAAAINIVVAGISLLLASRLSGSTVPEEAPGIAIDSSHWPVYLAIGLSGATALGAEVVWTRLLGMLLLGTVYVFSIILAVFLVGLALGSGAGSWLIKRVRPQLALGWCQILLLVRLCVDRLHDRRHASVLERRCADDARSLAHVLSRSEALLLAILPPTLFWGASFPLACAAVAKRRRGFGPHRRRRFTRRIRWAASSARSPSAWS